jgi:hypothetical protein
VTQKRRRGRPGEPGGGRRCLGSGAGLEIQIKDVVAAQQRQQQHHTIGETGGWPSMAKSSESSGGVRGKTSRRRGQQRKAARGAGAASGRWRPSQPRARVCHGRGGEGVEWRCQWGFGGGGDGGAAPKVSGGGCGRRRKETAGAAARPRASERGITILVSVRGERLECGDELGFASYVSGRILCVYVCY